MKKIVTKKIEHSWEEILVEMWLRMLQDSVMDAKPNLT